MWIVDTHSNDNWRYTMGEKQFQCVCLCKIFIHTHTHTFSSKFLSSLWNPFSYWHSILHQHTVFSHWRCKRNISLFFFYQSVGPYITNCDGKTTAIKMSLQNLLFQNMFQNSTILIVLNRQYCFRCTKNLFSILHLSTS